MSSAQENKQNGKESETAVQAADDSDASSPNSGLAIPPDGGYGWVIMIASFFTNVIVDGVCFSFGIFYLEFLEYFGESEAKTSWVGSVLNGMYLGMGPIVGALASRFGCRIVAICGSVIAAIAYVISTFSPNVTVLILTYGALGGIGFGLMYLPAIVMVGFYFERRRAFATGVAVCGSGIGGFIFAPLCRFLVSEYGWQGATWIIAGICLNGIVIGALFRPLEAQQKCAVTSHEAECAAHDDTLANGHQTTVPDSITKPDVSCLYSLQDLSQKQFSPTANSLSMDHLNKSVTHSEHLRHRRQHEMNNPLNRKDIFYSGSIQNLPEFKQSPDVETYIKTTTKIPDTGSTNDLDDRSLKGQGCCSACSSLKKTMDISLLADPVFLIYGISCFLCMAGFYVPFTYLPPHAAAMGLTKSQGAWLISIIGIANTVARVVCGFISDMPSVDALLLNNLALVLAGVATFLCPLCYNFALLSLYAAVFGCGIAVFVSLRSILMVELMGLDRLTSAFGLVTMFQGLSAFIGAPLAGALKDATGDYTYSFYMAGATLFLAGFICFPLRRLNACLKHRNAQQKENSEQGANGTHQAEHLLKVDV